MSVCRACPPAGDNTTVRMRTTAVQQLQWSSPSALRASWDLDLYFDRTYVISLPKRSDRQQRVREQLKSHSCRQFEIFPAVDGFSELAREPSRWQRRMMTDEVDVIPTPEGRRYPMTLRAATHGIGALFEHVPFHAQGSSDAFSATTPS